MLNCNMLNALVETCSHYGYHLEFEFEMVHALACSVRVYHVLDHVATFVITDTFSYDVPDSADTHYANILCSVLTRYEEE